MTEKASKHSEYQTLLGFVKHLQLWLSERQERSA